MTRQRQQTIDNQNDAKKEICRTGQDTIYCDGVATFDAVDAMLSTGMPMNLLVAD